MSELYVLITLEKGTKEPEVLAVGTEQEVKAKAFDLLEDVLCHQGTVIPVSSEYGRTFLAQDFDTTEGRRTVRIFIQHK